MDLFESEDDVLALLSTESARPRQLCYVNAHSLNLAYVNAQYRAVLAGADLVLNDGIGLQIAARMQGRAFPINLNGSDFTLSLLRLAAARGWRVFLYGGHPGVAEAAAARLESKIEDLQVVGVCDGYVSAPAAEIVAQIKRAQADILIVALGQPAQELWIHEHLAETGCQLGLGVGAFLDFISGRITRAPRWMNRLGIEWLFRLVQEPRRLWTRYLVGNPLFLWRAWRYRGGESRED